MRDFRIIATAALLVLVIGTFHDLTARTATDAAEGKAFNHEKAAGTPQYNIAAHRVGKIGLAVTNTGTLGIGFYPGSNVDFFTGDPIGHSCEYPRGSRTEYLYAATLWIGSTQGRDTLVSTGADGWSSSGREMYPDGAPFGGMIKRVPGDPGAVSHEDYIAVYTDTFRDLPPPDYFGRPHIPLDIEVTQSSYAWLYAWTEDFVLMNYQIKNIGTEQLDQVHVGFYVDADVCFDCNGSVQGFRDDLAGFLETYSVSVGNCEFLDTLNMAWIADNDGDFNVAYESGFHPAPDITATKLLGAPTASLTFAFNWWVSNSQSALDFGPRLRPTAEDPMRDFGTGGLGTPEGDHNKHYILRHPEFDYDQAYTASILPNDISWLYPNQTIAGDIADGFDTRYLLSFGPFDIAPGQTLPITMAYVAGENLHTNAANIQNLPDNPDAYYSNLDFSDLALNARWAGWIYDNPGVDTDQDGYFGKFRICCSDSVIDYIDQQTGDTVWDYTVCDTIYYEGDGVPDFSVAPSQAGQDMVWVEPRVESLWVRWNGLHAETQEDALTGQIDFEGYRAYLSPDGTPGSYAEVESYDINDYLKYTFSDIQGWELRDYPLTLEELRCLYGASCADASFDPNDYTEQNPLVVPNEFIEDSLFYFAPFDLNKSEFGVNTQILKRFPAQPYPSSLDPDQADPSELTADGYLKYFEYELTISNLLPNECYYVNITRTDFGAPQFGLPGDESDLIEGDLTGCAQERPGFHYDAGWNLVSAPVDLDSPLPADIFGGNLPFWQLYGWNGAGYYSPTEMNGCGAGYWLFAPEAAIVDYTGTDCNPSGGATICVQVDAGWSLLGSPFLGSVSVNDAAFTAQGETVGFIEARNRGWIDKWLYKWTDQSYYSGTNYVQASRSAWFASFIDDLEICWQVYDVPRQDQIEHDLFAASDEHTMTISLLGTSEMVQIGVDEKATQGFDSKFDMPSPPPSPGAKAGIVIESANAGMWKQLRTDVRPLENELIWTLRVKGVSNGELQFADVSLLTQLGYSITLVNSQARIVAVIENDLTVKVEPGSYSIVATRTVANPGQIPSDYVLSDNYPNPFNPSTTIRFGLPVAGQVRLAVYNLLGQRVATLVDGAKPAGWHEVSWNGRNDEGSAVSSGVYFYRLETGEFTESRKMLLVK